MSNGLQTVLCPHCQKSTEIIPGTVIAECDFCHRLFRPSEAAAAPADLAPSREAPDASLAGAPPWETGTAPLEISSWETASVFHGKTVGGSSSQLSGVRERLVTLLALRVEMLAMEEDEEVGDEEVEEDEEVGDENDEDALESDSESDAKSPLTPDPALTAQKSPPAQTSQATPIFLSVLLLLVLFFAYRAFLHSNIQKSRHHTRTTVGQTHPQTPAAPKKPVSQPPADAPSSPEPQMDIRQNLGKNHVKKNGIPMTQQEQESAQEIFRLAREKNFYRWGFGNARVQVLVLAPMTYIGVARLKQLLNEKIKKLEPFRNDAELLLVLHWGGTDPGAQTAADWLYLTGQAAGTDKMMELLDALMADSSWRVKSLEQEKLEAIFSSLQLSMKDLDAKRQEVGLEDARQKIMGFLNLLELNEKDLTFVINEKKYNKGVTLYELENIINYLIFETSKSEKETP